MQEPTLAPGAPFFTPRVSFAYEALVDIGPMESLGPSPLGERRIVPILGGRFAGPRLNGKVRPGGADRQTVTADGLTRLDALYEIETDDGAVITVRNRVQLDKSDPNDVYARSVVELTAPTGPHDWVNKRIFVGTLTSMAPAPQVLIRVFLID